MLGRRRTRWATWMLVFAIGSLALLLAACTATTFHWITPVATLETADAQAVETPEPAAEEAVAEATEEPEEEAEEAMEEPGAGTMPPPIEHRLARREACSDCHTVDSRDPSPADHVKYATDDICLYCHMPEEGPEAVPSQPDPVTPEFCLTCHGPFEELMARTAGYVADDGSEVNPHVPVPHDKTDPFACKNCHDPHPLPVVAPEEIPQASVQYCYAACHHEYNWEPCSQCH